MSNIDELWLLNTHDKDVTIPLLELSPPRMQTFRPGRPVPLPRAIALKYMNVWRTIKVISDPAPYLEKKAYHQLVIRDSGLGDLLLIEPTLRTLAEGGRNVSLMTKFVDPYKWHPSIKYLLGPMKHIGDIAHNAGDFDDVTDMRYASEKHEKRAMVHRSDIYSLMLNVIPADKEPRLYWKLGKPSFKRESGMRYVGMEFDAQDTYRRFPKERAEKIVAHFIQSDPKLRIVIMGHRPYLTLKHKNIIDLQGKTNLTQCIDTIAALDSMVAVDSGLLHVALTLHIPTVAFFGKMNPDLRLRYYKGPREVVVKNINCRPCSDLQDVGCLHGNAMNDYNYQAKDCFKAPCTDIPPSDFYDAFKRLPAVDAPMVYPPREDNLLADRESIGNSKNKETN